MSNLNHHSNFRRTLPTVLLFVMLIGASVYEYLQINKLTKAVETLTTQSSLSSRNIEQLAQNFSDLRNQTLGLSDTLTSAQQNIDAVKNQVGGVAQTVGSISGTVGTLQKLAQVDPQILKKYSKVYFTNENYTPAHLTLIPTDYLYSSLRSEQFLSEAYPYLQNMINSAKSQGTTIYVKSAYRSFAEQKSLKSSYTVTYGAGTANAFSADQGYSEHQLGTTADFTAPGLNSKLDGFDKTQAYLWLLDNAHFYGFILSYPKGNKYYVYEPWHWRYVGIKLATYLFNNKLNFYDLDQREIDKYLVDTF